jgi:hypothetical protein
MLRRAKREKTLDGKDAKGQGFEGTDGEDRGELSI